MAFNFSESGKLKATDWLLVLWHGLKLDLSTGAYLMVIPVLSLSISSLFNGRFFRIFIKIYSYIFLFIVLYLGVIDMNLYSYWGFKLDLTPLVYMKTPREAMASVSYLEIGIILLILILTYVFWLFIYHKLVFRTLSGINQKYYLFSITGLMITSLLFIPIRGGISIAPINISSVYFHTNRFANHSAINVFWNTAYSIVERKNLQASYHFMEDDTASRLFSKFYPVKESSTFKVVKDNSSIILIILESFSNRIIGRLGGEPGITPEMDRLTDNSIVFSNFFATGDRSDKGIVAIFSGFPAQPTTSIINYPSKTQSLPFLLESFHDSGYNTSFYYGGNINFANFRSYLTNPSLGRIVTSDDFPPAENIQKWGVPDEFLFKKMLTDIDTIRGRFFISCFTLSSHDPYDFPGGFYFGDDNFDEKSKSGFYYTDHCIGDFIAQAKTKPWWENTLIIILSDHGSRTPYQVPNHVKAKFQIPMIWTGGSILLKTEITKYSSQTDFPATLLRQFGLNSDGYTYSNDIFDPSSPSFAFYFFNNGFGFMSDSVSLIFDNNLHNFISREGMDTAFYEEASKAYLQMLSNDFHSR